MTITETLIEELRKKNGEMVSFVEDQIKSFKVTGSNGLSLDEAKKIYTKMVEYQRFLELRQQRLNVYSGTAYFTRASAIFEKIVDRSRTNKETVILEVSNSHPNYHATGLSIEGRKLCDKVEERYVSGQGYSLTAMKKILLLMELDFVEFFEDLRMISELSVYPIEKRIVLKAEMLKLKLSDVVEYIENAENFMSASPPKIREALSNCRFSIEALLY